MCVAGAAEQTEVLALDEWNQIRSLPDMNTGGGGETKRKYINSCYRNEKFEHFSRQVRLAQEKSNLCNWLLERRYCSSCSSLLWLHCWVNPFTNLTSSYAVHGAEQVLVEVGLYFLHQPLLFFEIMFRQKI